MMSALINSQRDPSCFVVPRLTPTSYPTLANLVHKFDYFRSVAGFLLVDWHTLTELLTYRA